MSVATEAIQRLIDFERSGPAPWDSRTAAHYHARLNALQETLETVRAAEAGARLERARRFGMQIREAAKDVRRV